MKISKSKRPLSKEQVRSKKIKTWVSSPLTLSLTSQASIMRHQMIKSKMVFLKKTCQRIPFTIRQLIISLIKLSEPAMMKTRMRVISGMTIMTGRRLL